MLWFLIALLGIAFVCVMRYNIKQTKAHFDDINSIKEDIPVIEVNAKRIITELQNKNFNASKKFSSMGYKFFEYKTKFNMPNNSNIEFDEEKGKVACYTLLPYAIEIYDFQDIIEVSYLINNIENIPLKEIDNIINRIKASGNTEINVFAGKIKFKNQSEENEHLGLISFINNAKCSIYDPTFEVVIKRAKEFGELIADIQGGRYEKK